MNEYDVGVIGGGAAGLSAALVLTRTLRQVAVVDAGQPRNAPAAHMQGFLGSDGLAPRELLAAGRKEVAGYGGHLLPGRVEAITPHPAHPGAGRMSFDIRHGDGSTMRSRRVLVTTGLRDDGQPLTSKEREQLAARAIGVVDTPVARLVIEDDRLTGVELTDAQVVSRAALFVRPRFVPNDTLLTDLGCATHDTGWVAVDAAGRTSIPGVWAAGNAVNPRAQVSTAAGEGSASAIAINNDLVDEDLQIAVTNFRLGLPL